jgi:hypothetical protein
VELSIGKTDTIDGYEACVRAHCVVAKRRGLGRSGRSLIGGIAADRIYLIMVMAMAIVDRWLG